MMEKLVKTEDGNNINWILSTDDDAKSKCFLCSKPLEFEQAFYCRIKNHVYCAECDKKSVENDCSAYSFKEAKSNEGHSHYLVSIRIVPEEVLDSGPQ